MRIKLNKVTFFVERTLFKEQKFKVIREVLDTELKYKDEELLAAWLILIYKYNNEYEWPEGIEINNGTKVGDLFGYKEKLQNFQAKEELYLQFCLDEQPSDFGKFAFIAIREEQKLKLKLQYNASLDEEIARNILNHYGIILQQLEDKKTVREITLLSRNEYNKIVYDWNRTEAPYPKDKTIHQLFEEQVEKTPDSIAVVFEDKHLTYRELNEKANQLAHCIRHEYKEHWREEIKGDTLIGIYIERSLEMIIGILGILKAGGAYVPFDSADPEERLRFKIADSGCKLVITSSKSIDHLLFLTETDTLPFSIDGYWEEISKFPKINPVHINKSSDLAYVIYTSGSTGQPKGVMVEHKSIINLLYSLNDVYDYEAERIKSTAFTSYVFDISVSEMMMPLLNGAELHIFSNELKRSPQELAEYVLQENINYLYLPPVLLSVFPKRKYTSLKSIIYGGEPCDKNTGVYWAGEKKLFNLYGPTETTIYSTGKRILNGEVEQIGKPVNNTTCYILDTNLHPVPIGVLGELYIGGDGVTRGYLNRLELTAERFISNPFASEEDKTKGKNLRIYKTGDLCRWLPDGNIEYIGRNDFQVKIRGFRIELGEIENVMTGYEGIDQAVVIAREKEGNKYLVGYYTEKTIVCGLQPTDGGRVGGVNTEKLREYMLLKLPDYMVPMQLVSLKTIPLNTSGKIDRKKLPEVEFAGDKREYVAPRTELEKKLCAIWSEALNIDESKIGIRDNFFSLGGNSLKAISVISKLHSEKINISVTAFFNNPSIENLCFIGKLSEFDINKKFDFLKEEYKKSTKETESEEFKNFMCERYKKYAETNDSFFNTLNLTEQKNIKNILLTGATGYLGSNILNELLATTKSHIYCIVRNKTGRSSEQRLKETFHGYFGTLLDREYCERVTVLEGNLAESNFGLSSNDYEELSEKIDTILHAAANVSYYGEYKAFYNDNVLSVINISNFAVNIKKKSLHYISTKSVCEEVYSPDRKFLVFDEDSKPGELSVPKNVYVRTKQEGEIEALNARKKGVDVNIYRIGNLVFNSKTGKHQKNIKGNAFYQIMNAYLNIGYIPEIVDEYEMSCVDLTAEAICLLVARANIKNQILHVYNPRTVILSDILTSKESGFTLRKVSFEDFMDILREEKNNSVFSKYIQNYMLYMGWLDEKPSSVLVKVFSERTNTILEKLNFRWNDFKAENFRIFL